MLRRPHLALLALVAALLTGVPTTAQAAGENPGAPVVLRTYRLALVSDPSYAAAVAPGATSEAASDTAVLAAKQAVVDRLNEVYGAELAIRFTLAPGSSDLNLRNAAEATTANGPCGPEPCFTVDQLAGGCTDDVLHRSRYVLGQMVGAHSYEIGQVLLGAAAGSSSYQWSAGTEYRAFGCAGSTTPTGDAFVLDLVAHELGHQLGAGSTFDGLSCAEDRNPDSATEPGSGSTLMGRAGTCATDDLQAHADPWFSDQSLAEIGTYVTGDSDIVPGDSLSAEVQSVALSGFDGTDAFQLSVGGVTTGVITRGANYTQDGVKAAILAALPTSVPKVRPFWQLGSFDDRGFEVTFQGYTDIPQMTVVPVSGTFTSQANDIDAGGTVKVGGSTSTTANKSPVVTAPADRTIPVRTPFALTGSATDANSDALVYQWQQSDLGGDVGLALTDPLKTDGPLFRVLAPTASPTRVFPDLAQVVAGNTNAATGTCAAGAGAPDCYAEWLPTADYAPATMTFRLVARDRNAAGGGTADDAVVLTVDKTTGPFRVTSQGTSGDTWDGGTSMPVTWTANTAALAANVRITLSTDGGLTFPTVLAASTPNDGQESVPLPLTPTSHARIKVEAVGNYFFDVSDADLQILDPSPPDPDAPLVTGVPAAPAAQWSDPLDFSFTATSVNGVPAGDITADLNGLPDGLQLTKTGPGAWSVTGVVDDDDGDYGVVLTVSDGVATTTVNRTVVVNPEAATLVYDGDTSATAPYGFVDVVLSATMTEVPDATPGSLEGASVVFTDAATGDVLCQFEATDLLGHEDCGIEVNLDVGESSRTLQVVPSLEPGNWAAPPVAPTPVVVSLPPPPETTITHAPPAWVLGSSTTVSFSSSYGDPGSFKCKLDGTTLPCSGTTSLNLTGLSVGSHRFTVAARGADSVIDATPAVATFTVPVDDRDLDIKTGRWKFTSAAAAYRGSYARVKAKNAELTYRVTGVRSLALVVDRAAGQGKVKVFLDGTLLGKVRLTGATAWSQVVPVAAFGTPRSGVVRIVSTNKKQVRIDGLGVSTL